MSFKISDVCAGVFPFDIFSSYRKSKFSFMYSFNISFNSTSTETFPISAISSISKLSIACDNASAAILSSTDAPEFVNSCSNSVQTTSDGFPTRSSLLYSRNALSSPPDATFCAKPKVLAAADWKLPPVDMSVFIAVAYLLAAFAFES